MLILFFCRILVILVLRSCLTPMSSQNNEAPSLQNQDSSVADGLVILIPFLNYSSLLIHSPRMQAFQNQRSMVERQVIQNLSGNFFFYYSKVHFVHVLGLLEVEGYVKG